MSKFDDLMAIYQAEATKLGVKVDVELLTKVTKALGPSIYNADAAKVSCADKAEIDRVKTNFLIKKLGLPDSPKLDTAVQEVCTAFGSANRNKYRALFYYMLVEKLGLKGKYA